MQSRQGLALWFGVLSFAALLLPLLVADAQLHVPHQSKNGTPSSPPTVEVPTNATLDYTGHAWECNRGYRLSGNECLVIKTPANATLTDCGQVWECEEFRESRVSPPQQHDPKEEIRQIQERLKTAGFDPGPRDGILGPRTLEALQRYLATK